MAEAFKLAREYDDVVLAEEFIDGQELTCAILGQGSQAEALPLVEIRAPDANYDYHNKYFGEETKYLCPAPIDAALSETIRQLSVRAYNALGARGWGRIDIMLSKRNEPYLARAQHVAGHDRAFAGADRRARGGISYEDLVLRILALATLDGEGRSNERTHDESTGRTLRCARAVGHRRSCTVAARTAAEVSVEARRCSRGSCAT